MLVRLYLHLFVGGLMPYLRYLCFFAHFVWIVLFGLPLRYSLTFIYPFTYVVDRYLF